MVIPRTSVWIGLMVVGCLGFRPAAEAKVVYVAKAGSDANDGLSWVAAKVTVQAGLNAAVTGDEVWVAAGTYVERIVLGDGIALYGGFTGSESELLQRDWKTNQTILDGNATSTNIVVTLPSGSSSLTRIDGFTICNGKNSSEGAAISCHASSAIIANNMIRDCAGNLRGIIACYTGAPVITGNTIVRNSTYRPESMPLATIDCRTSSPIITHNQILGNALEGIRCTSSTPVIANNTISGNTGCGVHCISCASATITNNRIAGNNNGGILCESSSVAITNNTIVGNSADFQSGTSEHGAVHCIKGTVTMANTIVAFNATGLYKTECALSLRSNCVYGNKCYNYPWQADPTGIDGNMTADPGLVDTVYGDYHLRPDSPCVDAGDDGAALSEYPDIDGQARIAGSHIDIGADESDGTTWPVGPHVIVRVSLDGDDGRDGLSWPSAKRTVQSAIDAVSLLGGDVWVKAGIYRERIILHPHVHVYGGFDGSENERPQRNLRAHPTILDGQFGGSVVTVDRSGLVPTTIDGFTIRHGKSKFGGGVYCIGTAPIIAHNTTTANFASSDGSGVYCMFSFPTITNNIIAGNIAPSDGSALCGVYCSAVVTNNTVTANVGSGVVLGGPVSVMTTNTIPASVMANTIVAFNSLGMSGNYCGGHDPFLRFNCVYGNVHADYEYLPDQTGINGNISADPGFATSVYGNVHIQPSSACVNAGEDAAVQAGWTDIDDQPRIAGAHVDIGADESDGTVWPDGALIIVRVTSDGNDANDGTSWSSPKRTVQAAVDAASTPGGEVWVKGGVYAERIILQPYVHIYGGFDGTETERGQRNWRAHPTILDGQSAGSVVTIAQHGYAPSTIDGFTIRGGRAPSTGGGLYCFYSSPTIANNTIMGNHAVYGGGIYCTSSFPTVTGNVIAGNTALSGGGIYCTVSSLLVAANTIAGNTASSGGGVYYEGNSLNIRNTIIVFNTSGVYSSIGAPSLRFTCVYGNGSYNYSGLADPTGTNGNISVDPRFVRTPVAGADGKWGTADDDLGDLHLKAGSPCIDAGDNGALPADTLTDLDGRFRFFDDPATDDTGAGTRPIVDMGAFEYIPGDFDRDGDIDADDMKMFTACVSGPAVAYSGDCAGADFDWDGDVDQSDFGFLQRCYSGEDTLVDPGCAG